MLVTTQNGRYGIEVKIDSLAKDGSTPWVVSSRGVERKVTEVSMACAEPMYIDSGTLSMERPVTFTNSRAQSSSSSSHKKSDESLPTGQRQWQHVCGVDRVLSHCPPSRRG